MLRNGPFWTREWAVLNVGWSRFGLVFLPLGPFWSGPFWFAWAVFDLHWGRFGDGPFWSVPLTEHKPPPTAKFQPKVIQDSNPDCRINPDLDVCRISPKMLWIHYLVSVIHFAKFSKNWAVTV